MNCLKNMKLWKLLRLTRHSGNTSMQEFLNEFSYRYNNTKSYQSTMSDVLAYRLLKAANLPEQHEQPPKATISDLRLDIMKDQLKKISGDLSCIRPISESHGVIKTEAVNHLQEDNSDNQDLYLSYSRGKVLPQGHRTLWSRTACLLIQR